MYNNDIIKKVGEINYNNNGSKMQIIKYINNRNVFIQFDNNNYKTKTSYKDFKEGRVKNPYDKTYVGIGFLGEGKYKKYINKKDTKQYSEWGHMLKRCYDKNYLSRFPTYKDCTVCKEWCNFQIFAKWFDENYYEIDNEKMRLDKDILIKGNKIYSPETCIFVPENINNLFVKSDAIRGKYPIGVTEHKPHKLYTTKYRARCMNNNKKRIDLGLYNTPGEAFYAYKKYKENLIKRIADEYKNKIPQKLYDAMYRYKVEITD